MTNEHTPLDAAEIEPTMEQKRTVMAALLALKGRDALVDFAVYSNDAVTAQIKTIEAQAAELAALRAREEVVARVACQETKAALTRLLERPESVEEFRRVKRAKLPTESDIMGVVKKEMKMQRDLVKKEMKNDGK